MKLEDAIQHCEEKMMELLEKTKDRNASDPVAIECFECADEHRQLAEWLKDYKRLLEQQPLEKVLEDIKAEINEKISHYEHFSSSNTAHGLEMALEIIDKHLGKEKDEQ